MLTRHCSPRKIVLSSKCTTPKKCSLQIAHPFKKCSPVGAHFPVPRKCSPQTAHLIRKCSPESMQQCKVHRNSRAYTVNAVHTHTLKRVPSQIAHPFKKCSPYSSERAHCTVLTAHPPKSALPKVLTPVKSARPKVLTLRKLLFSKFSPFQKCSSHFAHPPKSALLKVLTPLKIALPKGLTLKKVLIP